MSVRVVPLRCHPVCFKVEGGEHKPELTRSDTGRWLAECPDCGTVLRVFSSVAPAMALVLKHAFDKEVTS